MSIASRRLWRTGHTPVPVVSGTIISAGSDLEAAIAAGSTGETFVLSASADQPYRISQPLPLKSGQTIYSNTGAVIKGSRIILDWKKDGSNNLWYTDITLQDYTNSEAQSNMTGHAYKIPGEVDQAVKLQDTFRDGVQLKRYMVKSNLLPGGFYHDYAANRTWVADDPAGHTIEIAVAEEAIHAYDTVGSCVLDGITVQHFACKPQMSAVYVEASGWEIKNCDFSYNHSMGLKLAYVTSANVHHNTLHHNGQMGAGQYKCQGTVMSNNDFSYNNYMGDYYALDWESGSIKYAFRTDCTFSKNTSRYNGGIGLWADIDNVGLVFDSNIIEDNESCGIRHEISFGAVISNNVIRRNGYGTTNGKWRTKDPSTAGQSDYFARTGNPFMTAGININCSGGWADDSKQTIEVFGNTVEYNQNGIFLQQRNRGKSLTFPTRTWLVQNVKVHNNIVTVTERPGDEWGDNISGMGAYEEPSIGNRRDFFYNWGNVLQNNAYNVDDISAVRFSGSDGSTGWDRYSFATYQTRGFDQGSTCKTV